MQEERALSLNPVSFGRASAKLDLVSFGSASAGVAAAACTELTLAGFVSLLWEASTSVWVAADTDMLAVCLRKLALALKAFVGLGFGMKPSTACAADWSPAAVIMLCCLSAAAAAKASSADGSFSCRQNPVLREHAER